MLRFCDTVDALSRFVGNAVSLLFFPLTLIATLEVAMRYLFNSPTTWAWDVNVQLFCVIVVLGAPSVFLNEGNVRMDIVVNALLSEATKRKVSICLLAFLIVIVGILEWNTGQFAWRSWLMRERMSTILSAPIYPLKIAIFCGITLLWLQVISVFLRQLMTPISSEGDTR